MNHALRQGALRSADFTSPLSSVPPARVPVQGRERVDAARTLLGGSKAMEALRGTIHRIARRSDTTVLVLGESGSGKDLAARAIHGCSPRADAPFVNVTCTALPAALLESELFGHERGAFTDAKQRHPGLFEQACGGTLFLDEIGDMDPMLQAKLLRVLEDKKVRRVGGTQDVSIDVRVIAATNVDLRASVRAGLFRQDLYYRLAVFLLQVPPLRERSEDIDQLAHAFLTRACPDQAGTTPQLSRGCMRKLQQHPWPGNVRELRNAVERALVLGDGPEIEAADLQLDDATVSACDRLMLPAEGIDLGELERDLVLQAIDRTQGNVTMAGKLLGMTRDQVRYRLAKYRADHSSAGDGSPPSRPTSSA